MHCVCPSLHGISGQPDALICSEDRRFGVPGPLINDFRLLGRQDADDGIEPIEQQINVYI